MGSKNRLELVENTKILSKPFIIDIPLYSMEWWSANFAGVGAKRLSGVSPEYSRVFQDITYYRYGRFISPTFSIPPPNAYFWSSDFQNLFWFWKFRKINEALCSHIFNFCLLRPLKLLPHFLGINSPKS